ncbi:MAG: apolipoprotein N-acyltransferase [Desulfomonilaceae bacterium]|nr:apolipoprotein N-acyltransferase [Desulfomonilaceae bacterium]
MLTRTGSMISGLIASAGGGVLLSLSFPPCRLDFAAWAAFIPLFRALSHERHLARAALYGASFGLAFFLLDVRWVFGTLVMHGQFASITAVVIFAGMVIVLAMFPAVFALFLAVLNKQGMSPFVFAPFAWVAVEYARATMLTGFPWDLIGYSQTGRPVLVQVADVTGIYGVSFLIVAVNVALWHLLNSAIARQRIPWRIPAVAAILLAITLGYGYLSLKHFSRTDGPDRSIPIGILQGNISQDVKWAEAARPYTFLIYEKLGQIALKKGARLLVWPETSVPVLFGGADSDWRNAGMISEKLGVPMLVGAPSFKRANGRMSFFNSAFLLDGNKVRDRYDKIHLVPFGEYMPLTWLLPLGPGIAAREADYSAGEIMTVMHVNGCPPFSVLICYEAIFPELSRLAVNNGARMLVNITNDGWFGRSAAPYQHLAMARIRSIENRVWLMRAANTGISAVVDPAGRIVESIALEDEGTIVAQVPITSEGRTFYTRFGDVFAWSCIGILMAAVLSVGRLERR